MLIEFREYLTIENIYLWTNFGILPFWLMLIIIPNSKITQIFVNSIIIPLILSSVYIFVIYQAVILDDPLSDMDPDIIFEKEIIKKWEKAYKNSFINL